MATQPTFFDVDPETSALSEPLGQPQAPSSRLGVHRQDDDTVNPATPGAVGVDVEEWREVPQALFCSWSLQRQLAYCAARDEHASISDGGEGWAEFYVERAKAYRQMLTKALR